MRRLPFCIALAIVATFSGQALCQEIAWAAGYPKPGTLLNGTIAVKGTVTPAAGWSVPIDKNKQRWARAEYWISGKTIKNVPIKVDANLNFNSEFGADLDRNATYNVVMVVTLEKMGEPDRQVGTAPGATKPK